MIASLFVAGVLGYPLALWTMRGAWRVCGVCLSMVSVVLGIGLVVAGYS